MVKTNKGNISTFRDLYDTMPQSLQDALKRLWKVPQRKDYHPEGNTLKHVITVVKRAIKTGDIDIVLAALFHDLGKYDTLQFRIKDRMPTAYGHEKVSATMVKDNRDYIRELGGNPVVVYYLVKQHMRVKLIDKMKQKKADFIRKNPQFDRLNKFKDIDKGGLQVDHVLYEDNRQMKMPIPDEVRQISDAFDIAGYNLYVVGGAVRDFMLGKSPKDYDLATDAHPYKSLEIIKGMGLNSLEVGKSFGVVIAIGESGEEYEIATFREDVGSGRRPDAVNFADISTDVQRRDLTINALFYDIDEDKVVDLVGGLDDLDTGTIRTVGRASDRFEEDKLRKLRALRFYARVGKKIDPDTLDALTDTDLEGVSNERIRDEFMKSIKTASSTKKYLKLADKLGYLDDILGGLMYDNVFVEEPDVIAQLAYLIRNNDIREVNKTLKELRYTNDNIRTITAAIEIFKVAKSQSYDKVIDLKRLYNLSDKESVQRFAQHLELQDFVRALEEFDRNMVDIRELQKKYSGKELGDAIRRKSSEVFSELL